MSNPEKGGAMILRTYTNTLLDLRSIQERLGVLQDRRLVLYTRYLGVKSPTYDKVGSGKNWTVDGMSIFLEKISEVDPRTGLSLDDELELLTNQAARLTRTLKEIRANLRKMEGTEFELYAAIVIDGKSKSERVREVREKNYLSEQRVWRYHYPKIKEELEKLRK